MDEHHLFLINYTNRLIEKAKCFPDISLWDGKMGISIYLFHLSRITQNERYEDRAIELLDFIYEHISSKMRFNFNNGLLGISCGLQYIISQGFVKGDSDEVLSEIDIIARNIIELRPVDIVNFENGICGVGFYLYHRLKDRVYEDNMTTLRLKEYLIYLIDWMESTLLNTKNINDFNDAYFLLCRLQKLNIFNFKVNKLLNYCLRKIVDFNCPISDNYEFLGIKSLKLLKPWM